MKKLNIVLVIIMMITGHPTFAQDALGTTGAAASLFGVETGVDFDNAVIIATEAGEVFIGTESGTLFWDGIGLPSFEVFSGFSARTTAYWGNTLLLAGYDPATWEGVLWRRDPAGATTILGRFDKPIQDIEVLEGGFVIGVGDFGVLLGDCTGCSTPIEKAFLFDLQNAYFSPLAFSGQGEVGQIAALERISGELLMTAAFTQSSKSVHLLIDPLEGFVEDQAGAPALGVGVFPFQNWLRNVSGKVIAVGPGNELFGQRISVYRNGAWEHDPATFSALQLHYAESGVWTFFGGQIMAINSDPVTGGLWLRKKEFFGDPISVEQPIISAQEFFFSDSGTDAPFTTIEDMASIGQSGVLIIGQDLAEGFDALLYDPAGEFSEVATTTTEVTPEDLMVWPNPASDQINVGPEPVVIYDLAGRPVASGCDQIDISGLAPGIYFVFLKNSESAGRCRFIKL